MNVETQIQNIVGEEGVLLYGLISFAYLNRDGEEMVGYITIEEPGVQQVLGMLTMTEHHIANDGIAPV